MDSTNNEIDIAYFAKTEIVLGLIFSIAIIGIPLFFIGIYHLLLTDKIIIDDEKGISRHRKFLTETYSNNKFANCIEYDYQIKRSFLDFILGSTNVTFIVKIRRGINDYTSEALHYRIDRSDEKKLIDLLSSYFNTIKVKI